MMQINRPTITFQNIAGDWKSSPRIPIISEEQLKTLMAGLSEGEPGIVEFESSENDRLQLGIGGPFVCAQFTTNECLSRYLCAKAKTVRATKDVEFLCGGTPTPIAPELCLSFEVAFKIADYFIRTGNRDPSVDWVEV